MTCHCWRSIHLRNAAGDRVSGSGVGASLVPVKNVAIRGGKSCIGSISLGAAHRRRAKH